MKQILPLLAFSLLIGCGPRSIQKGEVYFIHYRTSATSSQILAGQDYTGENISGASVLKYRNPVVALYPDYISISYPGTDMKDKMIPRETLIELQWKKP